jgi:hypothetical protein
MREATWLLLASALLATLAWAFLHYLGADGFSAMPIIAILVLGVDNARLRVRLRAQREEGAAP